MAQRKITITYPDNQAARLIAALKDDMGNEDATNAEVTAHLNRLTSRLVRQYLRRIDHKRMQSDSDLDIT